MSGGRGTGERGFDFLLELRDEITRLELTIALDHEPTPRARAVMEALGARVVTSAAG